MNLISATFVHQKSTLFMGACQMVCTGALAVTAGVSAPLLLVTSLISALAQATFRELAAQRRLSLTNPRHLLVVHAVATLIPLAMALVVSGAFASLTASLLLIGTLGAGTILGHTVGLVVRSVVA